MKESPRFINAFPIVKAEPRVLIKRLLIFSACLLLIRVCVRVIVLNLPWIILKLTDSKDISYIFTQMVIILFIISVLLSVYFTKVNQVQIRHIIRTLYPLIKSGFLDNIL
ncbi:MAG: hypothetical protein ACOX22_06260 [Caldicoprobacterales bacterium]|jgi:hypothetical protein